MRHRRSGGTLERILACSSSQGHPEMSDVVYIGEISRNLRILAERF